MPSLTRTYGRVTTVMIAGGLMLASTPAMASVERDPAFGNSEGTIEETFNGAPTFAVDAVATDTGKILFVGETNGDAGDADMFVARLNADGTLDETFGSSDGYTRVEFDLGGTEDDTGLGIALRGTEIVIAGYARNAAGNDDIAVARLDASGAVVGKNHFDPNGGNEDLAWDVAVDSMKRIYVAGESGPSGSEDSTGIAIRLDGTLSLDTGFASSGVFEKTSSGGMARYQNVEVRPDNGKVVLAGQTDEVNTQDDALVTQLKADGSRDTAFGNGLGEDGDYVTDTSTEDISTWAMELDGSGRIVAGVTVFDQGDGDEVIGVARLQADGSQLDTSFSPGGERAGTTSIDPSNARDAVYDLEIDSRGRIVFVGDVKGDGNGDDRDGLIGRLKMDGSSDESFSTNGYKRFDLQENNEGHYGLVLRTDEKFVSVGGFDTNASLLDTAFVLGTRTDDAEISSSSDSSSTESDDSGGSGGGALGLLTLFALMLACRPGMDGRRCREGRNSVS